MTVALCGIFSGFASDLNADGEDKFLDFVDYPAVFEKAAKDGKWVILYFDWPG